jgi:hypothetical protein
LQQIETNLYRLKRLDAVLEKRTPLLAIPTSFGVQIKFKSLAKTPRRKDNSKAKQYLTFLCGLASLREKAFAYFFGTEMRMFR